MRRTAAAALAIALLSWSLMFPASARANDDKSLGFDPQPKTATPIKHLVVIFDENNSFDHYFGTYPRNDPTEPPFHADPDTPAVDGLTPTLLMNNPNMANAGNPFLLTRGEASTCDNVNKYTPEQEAFDSGLLDKFNITSVAAACGTGYYFVADLAMGYYTGNTVTALWNYAQHYAMSDNFFDSEFGGTVEGHLNLLSGQTHGLTVTAGAPVSTSLISNNTVINNVQPSNDDCAIGSTPNITMTGKNVGDLLNGAHVTWGWFYDGFAPTSVSGGVASCSGNANYNSHYAPFNYWLSTSNPHHLPPSSVAAIGTQADQANHNYDLSDLWQALANGNLPAVTFIKAAKPNTGHPMDSTPLEEQAFLVSTINQLEESPYWSSIAIIIAYDDSDGWYDHVAAPIVNFSTDPGNDAIQGSPTSKTGSCGAAPSAPSYDQDRCGFGVRLPFLVISPFAKHNYVDHSLNDTTSILRFIEYNWGLGTIGDPQSFDVLASGTILGMFDFNRFLQFPNQRLILDPETGEVERWY